MVLHFKHSRGPFTLNFVSSTFTLCLAKCHPHVVDQFSSGMPQLAHATRCLTRPRLFLEIAHSFWSVLSGFLIISVAGDVFFSISFWITLTIFISSFFLSSFELAPVATSASCCEPLSLTFIGSCSNASFMYRTTADDFHLPKKAMSNNGSPCLAYIMAPDLLAECPVALVSRCFCHKRTSWILDSVFPSFLGKRLSSGSSGASLNRPTPIDHAQCLVHGHFPQHPNVLDSPLATWSIFDFGTFSLKVFFFQPTFTWPTFTLTTSMDLNIHMTAHAKTQAMRRGSHFTSLTVPHVLAGISSSFTSWALFSGPLSLFKARLHMVNFLSKRSLHTWPPSMWAHLASARYWSAAFSLASSSTAAISTMVFVVTGANGYPHCWATISIFLLLEDFDAQVDSVKNFWVNFSFALLLHQPDLALSIAVSSAFLLAPLDSPPAPFVSWLPPWSLASLLCVLPLFLLGLALPKSLGDLPKILLL